MKEKIIEILNHPTDNAEIKASRIVILFNQHIVDALKKAKDDDIEKFVDDIFIKLN